jgi:diadenosine tetraphosphate (Ap4A) HIT family hydrolase
MSECVFCAVSAGRAERSLVYEDETSVAVMDISPVNPGHVLVIPKTHAAGLDDLADDVGSHLFAVALRISRAVRRSPVRSDGINLFLADGEAAGQDVFHVHLHVLPRFDGDPLRIERAGGSGATSRDELDRVASQLQEALA